ncbi:MAG: hypothetical protein HQM09_08640 [Candidatus Riflebacteria bacterium]|nr:hypothetical protein [Candidatus Riflebacteria bacterium]
MNFQTYRMIEKWLFGFLLAVFFYAGYSVYQAFTLWAFVKWTGIIFTLFIFIGMIIPDWSDLEDVQDSFIEILDMLEAKKLTVFARELESARRNLFLERDRAKRAIQLLEKIPLETVQKEMAETLEAKKNASPENEGSFVQRTKDLEHTLARLQDSSQQKNKFEELKKDVIASLQNLRVRLESSDETQMPEAGSSVSESFRQIISVMNRLEKP